jgi:hypothetical protein
MPVKTGELLIRPWGEAVKILCVHAGGDMYQVIHGKKNVFSVKAVETRGFVETAERKWREMFPQTESKAGAGAPE